MLCFRRRQGLGAIEEALRYFPSGAAFAALCGSPVER
jgi:hypothetical protein